MLNTLSLMRPAPHLKSLRLNFSLSIPDQTHHDCSAVGAGAVLKEEDSLPGAELKSSFGNGNAFARSG